MLIAFVFQVVKTFLIPFIKSEGERLQHAVEGPLTSDMDKIFVDHIKTALLVSAIRKESPAIQTVMRN